MSVEPLNAHDELPVGGGGGGGGGGISNGHSRPAPAYVEDESIDVMNRPIMPKELDYAAAAAAATAGDDDADPLAATGMPTEAFAPGQHPLEGVPNLANLPTPEQLTIKSR